MAQTGDLVYFPAGTEFLQYNKEIENLEIDPEKTYIGPAPIKYKKLEKPANLLMLEKNSRNKYSKVLFEGEEWYVKQ